MNKKQAKRWRDIRTKLTAAICMLLVSSIMMVSTTYAWFTLSTAPEVTGINTAVGANGNLEIALLPKTGGTAAITSAAGDSVRPIQERNVTWGNLVDLSDGSVYGLDKITLYPAALNISAYDESTGTITLGSTLLKTPTYGSDGRVAELVANTSNGYFDATKGDFYPNDDMGVRGVGTASGMTPRQLAYRNARSAANTAAAQAKSIASNSLNNNGSTLANIAIKKATSDSASYNDTDVASLMAIVNDLLGTESKTGALQSIETAYMQYILAFAASKKAGTVAGESAVQHYQVVQGLIDAENATLASVIAGLNGITLPTQLNDAAAAYATTLANVKSAKDTLENLSGGSYTWEQISPALNKLADTDGMEINGIKASEIKKDDNMSELVNSVASGGLKVTMRTGGGVYADIADHCGDYSASVVIEEVTYNGLTLKNMTARMETASTKKPANLSLVSTAVEGAGAPDSDNSTAMPITDMFGYVIDMAFRTNAADSKLLLQDEGVDRIYGDNANEGTMGNGSNMTFDFVSNELLNTAVGGDEGQHIKELMKAINIVFFEPGAESNKVIMFAELDAANAEKDAAGSWKAGLSLYKLVQESVTTEGSATKVTFKKEPLTSNEIMPLVQNQAQQLSVLVYLDGEKVTNEDVAASAATSMSGKLNLQFASSATLVPMDYSQLHTPSTSGGTTDGGTTETTAPAETTAPTEEGTT